MDRYDYMVTIIDNNIVDDYLRFFHKHGIHVALKATGYGMAYAQMRKFIGLDEADRCIIFTVTAHKKAAYILNLLEGERQFNRPGAGIAFTIPVSGFAGTKTMQVFTDLDEEIAQSPCNDEEKEEITMKATSDHDLIMAVAARGHADTVMGIARKTGVTGGTVIHALGIEPEPEAREFYGISLGKERELIIMLVSKEIKEAAMKAIADEAGPSTPAQCVLMSLPVNGVAGL